MARGYCPVFLLIYAFAMLASVHSTFPKPTISTEHQAEVVNATCRIPDSWTRTTRWTKDVNVRELRIFQCRSSEPKAECANVTLASWKISDRKNSLPYEGELASGAMVRMWRSGPWPAMNRGNLQDPVLSVLTPRSEYGTFYCAIRYFNDTEEGAAMEDNAIVDLTLRQHEIETSSLYPHPRFQLQVVHAHALTVTWTASGQSDGEEVRVTRALASKERAGEGKMLLLADQGHIEWDKSEEVLLANVERLRLTLYTRDRGIPFAYGCHVHSPACVGDKRDLCRCGWGKVADAAQTYTQWTELSYACCPLSIALFVTLIAFCLSFCSRKGDLKPLFNKLKSKCGKQEGKPDLDKDNGESPESRELLEIHTESNEAANGGGDTSLSSRVRGNRVESNQDGRNTPPPVQAHRDPSELGGFNLNARNQEEVQDDDISYLQGTTAELDDQAPPPADTTGRGINDTHQSGASPSASFPTDNTYDNNVNRRVAVVQSNYSAYLDDEQSSLC